MTKKTTKKNGQVEKWYKFFYEKPFATVTYTKVETAKKQLKLLKALSPRIDKSCKIFDQCCGWGSFCRVAATETRAERVLGIDLSEHFINEAKKMPNCPPSLEFKVANALYYAEDGEFDIATCWHTSCAYSTVDDENMMQFKCLSKSLKLGGFFLVDTINPMYVKKHFIDRKCRIEDDGTIVATWYHLADNILSSAWRIASFSDDKISTFCGLTKMYTMTEYDKMLRKVGLKVVGALGDYDGNRLSDDLGRMILFGIKLS